MTRRSIADGRRPNATRATTFAVLALVMLGGCGNPPSPTPSPSVLPSASPSALPSSAAPSESPAEAACTAADIVATGGPWGGAAGSRGSDVTVQNDGTAACLLPASPTVAFVDAAGTVVLTNAPPRAGAGPSVEPAGKLGFSVLYGNWCDQAVRLPLHVSLALATATIDVANLAVTTADELPPCNGPGQPASISTTDWAPG